MIINNFEQIKKMLTFESGDEFYHLQILKRKKDCPTEEDRNGNNSSRTIKDYYITSIEQLDKYSSEIIQLCKVFNARAYIGLNVKSFEAAAFKLGGFLLSRIQTKSTNYCHRDYASAVMGTESKRDKKWIIDVDTKDADQVYDIVKAVCSCRSQMKIGSDNYYPNIYEYIPTVQGWHLVTIGFDLSTFHLFEESKLVTINKDGLTLLYYEET